jgi:hypothetical protein
MASLIILPFLATPKHLHREFHDDRGLLSAKMSKSNLVDIHLLRTPKILCFFTIFSASMASKAAQG